MKSLIGFNMIVFAVAFGIAQTVGEDLTIKEKTIMIVSIQFFTTCLSIGAFLMTEG